MSDERRYCERCDVWLELGGDPHTGCAISGCVSSWEVVPSSTTEDVKG